MCKNIVKRFLRMTYDCYGSMSNVQKHSEMVFTHDTDITYLPPLTQPTNEAPDDSYGGYVENSEDDRVERECTSKDGISGAKVTQMSKVGLS